MSSIVILASGEGTTAQNVIVDSATGKVGFDVSAVISNNPNPGVFKRVKKLNKKYGLNVSVVFAENDLLVQKAIQKFNPDLIVLMGYMKKIGPELVARYGWKTGYKNVEEAMMINTHPGLLPATKGLYGVHVQQYVLNNKLPQAGQTLHVVSENYDEGPIIAEHKTKVDVDETAESLFDRVKKIEKIFIATDIENFINKRQEY